MKQIALICALGLLVTDVAWSDMRVDEPAVRVTVLSTGFVLTRKFELMAEIAAEENVELRWLQVDAPGADPGAVLADADLVIVDSPRADDSAQVDRAAGDALRASGIPALHINVMSPPVRFRGDGLPPSTAQDLFDYYTTGMPQNHRALFRYIATWARGEDFASVPRPVSLPDGGIYHPDAERLVFPAPGEYLEWWSAKHGRDWRELPVAGIEISSSFISDGQTRLLADMVHAVERDGMLPLMFYRTTITARTRAESAGERPVPLADGRPRPAINVVDQLFPNPLDRTGAPAPVEPVIMLDGRPLPDVMIVSNFLGGDPEGRKQWYQSLDMPVLQTILYRDGDREAYLADRAGIATFAMPFQVTTPEYIGLSDPVVVAANEDGEMVVMPEQLAMVLGKAQNIVRLRQLPEEEKRLALLFWNHPPGEHNQGASNLNVPRSIEALVARLRSEGYAVDAVSENEMVAAVSRLLRPRYRDSGLDELLEGDDWASVPLDQYRRWYDALPASVRAPIEEIWGAPEASGWMREVDGEPSFIVPRLALGNLVILPQPARDELGGAGDEVDMFHDTSLPVHHAYLAAYLWIREGHGADAIIHFGTHGTQEWLPGKERGLWAYDEPKLLVGNLPVLYPYIVDNIAEAVHVRRRGRGTIISHQTPPFAPAGLSDEFVAINDLIRDYHFLEDGLVRANTREMLIEHTVRMDIHSDLEWQVAELERNFDEFLRDIEDYLEDLGLSMQPLGLHTLGQVASPEHRASTIMQMLGDPLYEFLGITDPGTVFRTDYREVSETAPFRFVMEQVLGERALVDFADPAERALVIRGREIDALLAADRELDALVAGLSGRWIDPSYGGDPVRNPDALPTGRNMYGFDPSRIPTRSAYAAGQEAMENLLRVYQADQGSFPEKLAFSMWSTETMRHLGMLEAQVLWAMGVQPVWDRGGRVIGMELVDLETLGRPRIDTVISLTGLYRDHFPLVMEWLNRAIMMVAESEEPEALNLIRRNTRHVFERLLEQGAAPADAREFALTRIFGNESGDYGTGLPEATLASDQWEEGDGQLAELYLSRMSWAYGPDPARWSTRLTDTAGREINAYAEQLRGTSAAVFSRSSNLRGLLDTDHPFEYLGGISLALNHLEGRSPELFVSNMRDPLRARLESASRFLSTELRSVYQHPNWIAEMQAEGYAGTLELLNTVNNFWGWQVMDRSVLRDDQWQAFQEIYVMDRYELGLREWFESMNPDALAQVAERMLEAIRKGYWEAGEQTVRELVETWTDLAERHDIISRNEVFLAYVTELAAGFGLGAASVDPSAVTDVSAMAGAVEVVAGMRLEQQLPAETAEPVLRQLWLLLLLLILLGMALEFARWRPGRGPSAGS